MRSILILLGAAGALTLAGVAQAQVIGGGVGGGLGTPVGGVTGGATGRVTAPDVPTEVVTDTARRGADTGRRVVKRARGAADEATDASARVAGSIRAGTTVRDSSGARIGKVIHADGSGYVQIQTRTGVMVLPEAALRMQGGVAVSGQSEAELRASGNLRVR